MTWFVFFFEQILLQEPNEASLAMRPPFSYDVRFLGTWKEDQWTRVITQRWAVVLAWRANPPIA